jgi:hypothetical protein
MIALPFFKAKPTQLLFSKIKLQIHLHRGKVIIFLLSIILEFYFDRNSKK